MSREHDFLNLVALIQQSRASAIKSVNTELINLYWNVGAYISKRIASANWGEKTVDELALFIQNNHPDLKGFNKRGLYRMRQFYDTYSDKAIVSPLATQLQNTDYKHNAIMSLAMTIR